MSSDVWSAISTDLDAQGRQSWAFRNKTRSSDHLEQVLRDLGPADRALVWAELGRWLTERRGTPQWFAPNFRWILTAFATAPSAAKLIALLTRRDTASHLTRLDCGTAVDLLVDREVPWVGRFVDGYATKVRPDHPRTFELVDAVASAGNVQVPVTEAVVTSWVREFLEGVQVTDGTVTVDPATRALACLDQFLPGVFDLPGVAAEFCDPWFGHRGAHGLVELARLGLVDRAWLIDQGLARLEVGGRPADLAGFVVLLDGLAPTPAELSGHARRLLALSRSADGRLVGFAATAIANLDDAGLVAPTTVVAVCTELLHRKEKGRARQAVRRLTALVDRHPDSAAEVAQAALVGVGHPALDVAEAALRLLAELPDLDPLTAREALDCTPPALRSTARTVLHAQFSEAAVTEDGQPGWPDDQPVERDRQEPFPTAIGPDAFVDFVTGATPERPRGSDSVILSEVHGLWACSAFEVALSAVVTSFRTDPHGLQRAVEGVEPWYGFDRRTKEVLAELLRQIRGDRPSTSQRLAWLQAAKSVHPRAYTSHPGKMRLIELATHLRDRPVGTLVSTPSWTDGTIDVTDLVGRLERAAAEGWEPWPTDLDQALARLTHPCEPAPWIARADAVDTPAGHALAQALRAGPTVVEVTVQSTAPSSAGFDRYVPDVTVSSNNTRPFWTNLTWVRRNPEWLPIRLVPHHRELVAAWMVPTIAQYGPNAVPDLEVLTGTRGPFGPVSAAVIGAAFTGERQTRTRVVDAVIAMDPTVTWGCAVGRWAGDLVAVSPLPVGRFVEPLTDVAAAVGPVEPLRLLLTMLPAAVGTKTRGVPDLLALATGLVAETRTSAARWASVLDGCDVAALQGCLTRTATAKTRVGAESRRLVEAIG